MTRIFTVTEAQKSKIEDDVPAIVESQVLEVIANVEQDPESKAKFAIDVERTKSLLTREKISKQLIDIIFNRNTENASNSLSWKKFILYSIIGIFAPSLFLCYITLIPNVDIVRYPEYWYVQPSIPVGLCLLYSAGAIVNCSAWMNIKIIKSWRNFTLCSLSGTIVFIFVWGAGTFGWWLIGYYPPVPLSGIFAGYGIAISNYFTIWFLFSKEWRKIAEFRKRIKYYLVALTLSQFLTLQYNVLAKFLLEYKDSGYQWVIALTLPLVIEFNSWVVTKLATKASGGDTRTVEVTCSHLMGTRHSLFLTYTLGSIATDTTSNIILGTDYLINLSLVIRLIRLKKKDPLNAEKQIDLLQDLVLAEMIEFVVPLVYVLVLCSAYFGPNSTLIGNVGNSYFQYNKVDNFGESLKIIGTFILVDIFSLISNTLILRIFAKISVYKALCVYVKKYGVIFTINLTLVLYTVSVFSSILMTQLLNHFSSSKL